MVVVGFWSRRTDAAAEWRHHVHSAVDVRQEGEGAMYDSRAQLKEVDRTAERAVHVADAAVAMAEQELIDFHHLLKSAEATLCRAKVLARW